MLASILADGIMLADYSKNFPIVWESNLTTNSCLEDLIPKQGK